MKSIYAKNYDRGAYGAYIWSQWRLFAALEEATLPLRDDPHLAPVYDEKLHRSEALEVDVRYWLGGTELPQEAKYDKLRSITEAYVDGLRRDGADAKAVLCQHFLHYNAVLSGGQFLGGMIAKRESIDAEKDPAGIAFYTYKGIGNPAGRVQRYMKSMDGIELSDTDRERMLVIMKRIYDEIELIFDASHEIAPMGGQAYDDAKAQKSQERRAEDGTVENLQLTLQALRKFDGEQGGRILLSLQGKIIDVSSGAESYGPGGSYNMFAGRDVTKCLALMDMGDVNMDQPDFLPETEDAKKSLDGWLKRLTDKYPVVGELLRPLRLTPKALQEFDGKDGTRILLSLQGKIIDVSSGAESYGPGGNYSSFAGRDVTKCLALMDISEANMDQPNYAPDTEDAVKSLEGWFKRLTSKYPVVGELVPPLLLTLDELRDFDGARQKRILLSLSGRVIDVTEGSASYGPGGSYNSFAGRDVTKALALMDLKEECLGHPDWEPDSEDSKKSLASWWKRLTAKYPEVGEIVSASSAPEHSQL